MAETNCARKDQREKAVGRREREVGREAVCAARGRGGGGQAVPKNYGSPNSTIIKEFKV